MAELASKKAHMEAPTVPGNPFIPIADGDGSSPILQAPDLVIERIFGFIRGNTKMKLESICHHFKQIINRRICWEVDDELHLACPEIITWLINETEFETELNSTQSTC